MTRINIIPVRELSNRHLIAEYRELPMVLGSLRRTLKSKGGLNKGRISLQYTLNKGHVYFFYNKLKYLENRYNELINEMIRRGMNPSPDNRNVNFDNLPEYLKNDWAPNKEEQEVARERINLRISQKPHLYPDAKIL